MARLQEKTHRITKTVKYTTNDIKMMPIHQHAKTIHPSQQPQKENWLLNWAQKNNIKIIRGTQKINKKGIPDYYLPEHNQFIEEKQTIKDYPKPHQLATLLQLQQQGYNTTIAIRQTQAIIPLNQYLNTLNIKPQTWQKITQQLNTENNSKLSK